MGCSLSIQPNYTNQCSSAIGDTYIVPGFCSKAGSSGNNDRDRACSNLGSVNGVDEWDAVGGGNACSFASGTNDECIGSGGVVGNGVTCQRVRFLGDPLTCCLQNIVANSQCFTNNKQATCDPTYRGPTQAGCQATFLGYCNSGPDYQANWANSASPCSVVLDANYANGPAGLAYARQLLGGLFQRYLSEYVIAPLGTSGTNAFQTRLLALATKYPAAAGPYLSETYCPQFSRQDLAGNLPKTNFCGCNLPIAQYTGTSSLLGVPLECDSLCAIATNVPRTNAAGEIVRCTQSICLIDEVSLDLVESNLGALNFTQLCGNCNGLCTCSIVNLNINAVNSTIGEINVDQTCSRQNCYRTDPGTGQLLEVDCQASADEQNDQANADLSRRQAAAQAEDNKRAWRIMVIVLSIILFFLLLIGLVLLLFPGNK